MSRLTADMQALVEHARLGMVASVCEDGTPNLSPKGTFVVVDGNTLAFGELRSPGTVENIAARPAVEVNFVDVLSRKGFRAKGTARFHARGSEAWGSSIHLFEHWGPLVDRMSGVVVIDVDSARGLTSPAYDVGATEDVLRAQWRGILLGE